MLFYPIVDTILACYYYCPFYFRLKLFPQDLQIVWDEDFCPIQIVPKIAILKIGGSSVKKKQKKTLPGLQE